MHNVFTDLLGIDHPIIQAPMVGVSTPVLAAAVSNAGALGSIGIGASSVEQARAMIRQTRALTSHFFNVNLFCHRPAHPDAAREAAWLEFLAPTFATFEASPPAGLKEGYRSFLDDQPMLDMLLAERPPVASFHFGVPPREWVEALHDAGIITLACVTTPAEAEQAEAAGVEVLVAQGIEAGGHRGVFEPEAGDAGLGTLALVRLLAARSTLPVVAAGGIMDGQGIAAAMTLGAVGVQLGTAFIACPESAATAHHRAALTGPRGADTRISAAISGRPARGLGNRLFEVLEAPDAPALPDYPICYDAAKALVAAAAAKGDRDFAVEWAGQGAPLARSMPAAELVRTLMAEFVEAG